MSSGSKKSASDEICTLAKWVESVSESIVNFKGAALAQHLERRWLPTEVVDSLEKSMLDLCEKKSGKKARDHSTAGAGAGGGAQIPHLPSSPSQYGPALTRKTEEVHQALMAAIQMKLAAAQRQNSGRRQLERVTNREDISHLVDAAVCCLISRTLLAIQAKYEGKYRDALRDFNKKKNEKKGEGKSSSSGSSLSKSILRAPKPPASFVAHAFKLLLHAFENFASQHMLDRSRFNLEDLGWDVPLLVQLVRFVTGTMQCGSATEIDNPELAENNSDEDGTLDVGGGSSSGGNLLAGGDGADSGEGDENDEAANNINRTWRRLYLFCQDADEGVPDRKSRRRGTIIVVNGLLTILLNAGNTTLCQRLVNSVEQTEQATQQQGGAGSRGGGGVVSPVATGSVFAACNHIRAEIGKFHFYRGRFYFQSTNYREAFSALQLAWSYIAAAAPAQQPSSSSGGGGGGGKQQQQQEKKKAKQGPVVEDEEVEELHITPQHQKSNEARILFYWCSTAIALGLKIPDQFGKLHPELMDTIFNPILQGISEGNVHKFVVAVDRHRALFRRYGVYFALLGARKFVYLQLLRRVCVELTHTAKNQELDASRIPLGIVVSAVEHSINTSSEEIVESGGGGSRGAAAASPLPHFDLELRLFKEDVQPSKRRRIEAVDSPAPPTTSSASAATAGGNGETTAENPHDDDAPTINTKVLDSVTLWIARLISEGYVKGYISYEHLILVLSRKEPFPVMVNL